MVSRGGIDWCRGGESTGVARGNRLVSRGGIDLCRVGESTGVACGNRVIAVQALRHTVTALGCGAQSVNQCVECAALPTLRVERHKSRL